MGGRLADIPLPGDQCGGFAGHGPIKRNVQIHCITEFEELNGCYCLNCVTMAFDPNRQHYQNN